MRETWKNWKERNVKFSPRLFGRTVGGKKKIEFFLNRQLCPYNNIIDISIFSWIRNFTTFLFTHFLLTSDKKSFWWTLPLFFSLLPFKLLILTREKVRFFLFSLLPFSFLSLNKDCISLEASSKKLSFFFEAVASQ